MSKFIVVACLLGAALLAGAPGAAVTLEGRDPIEAYPSPSPGWATLEVVVDGRPLEAIAYRGKTYLPVPRLGAEFQVRVRNHTAGRIAALVAIDGLSVINGQPASDRSPGYLVGPRQTVAIKGWRRNLETVAAFRFVDRRDSYASRTGQSSQIGTISLVAIEERVRRPVPLSEKTFTDRSGSVRRPTAMGSTGTGYGRDVDSSAYYVPFVRGARRHSVVFHYDTLDALRRAGVPVGGLRPLPVTPEFAPPPPR